MYPFEMIELRSALLQAAFRLLYGPLVFLHEPAGRFLWGAAWSARRLHLTAYLYSDDHVLDVGCGEGQLLMELCRLGFNAAGVEPSGSMRRRCKRKSLNVRAGTAQRIPWPNDSIDVIVVTYPGDWIFDAESWSEFRRVTRPGGRVVALLGGDYCRGPFSILRSTVIQVLYPRTASPGEPPGVVAIPDQWGTYHLLICELN